MKLFRHIYETQTISRLKINSTSNLQMELSKYCKLLDPKTELILRRLPQQELREVTKIKYKQTSDALKAVRHYLNPESPQFR